MKYLSIFSGAGGLSEGFTQAGFEAVAHVEMDEAACFTLRTRAAYHWLAERGCLEPYEGYLNGKLTREQLYAKVPEEVIQSVINATIAGEALSDIFQKIDALVSKEKIDLIVGGPPCQAYSLVGRARDKNRMLEDERNYLYKHYSSFLEKYRPTRFIFENVTGLLSAKDKDGSLHLNNMRDTFRKIGYETELETLSADDYGVPQKRRRVILTGRRKTGGTGFFPMPEKWRPEIEVSELFRDLPALKSGEGEPGPCKTMLIKKQWPDRAGVKNEHELPVTWHQARPHTGRDLEIYRRAVELWNKKQKRLKYDDLPKRLKTHRNRHSFMDRFKVVAGNLPASHTVVAHIAKDGHYYIHPDLNQNRSITPREAARLQTFPDDYYFESKSGVPSRTPAFQQIGNAVPVLLARKIAEKLKENWL